MTRLLSLYVVLIAAVAPAAGQTLFTPQHIAKLKAVTSLAISPDGSNIAYVLSVPRRPLLDDDGPSWAELHVVASNGVSRVLVGGEVNASEIAWVPNSNSISFLAKRGKDSFRSLYLIRIDGGEARKILDHETDIEAYSWSSDGKRVAILAKKAPPAKQKDLEKKGFNQQIYEESVDAIRIWIAKPDAPDSKPRLLEIEGSASELRWSPVGSLLAFALAPTALVDHGYMRRKITVADADTGKIIARVNNPGKLGPIVWSPDATHIAYISAADINDPSEGRFMVAAVSGGSPREVLPNYEGHVRAVVWRDREALLYLGDEGVWSTVGEVRRDGSGRKTHLPAGKTALMSFDAARDGRSMALIVESPQHPPEVFSYAAGGEVPKRLTHSDPWLGEMRFARQEVIKYKARDGLELEGLLIRPLGERNGVRYPLILVVHGGPESHYRNGWLTGYSSPGQLAAARDFAVFYPNYRGSTGRGVAFSKLSQADPAGKEFDDFVDGVDHLIQSGLVDRDKVAITGGSYGGYATAWGSTYYSERFAAGVMFVGISDKISKTGTTDIAEEEFLVHARKRPWDNWQFFQERSPIFHAGKSRTPLLILHGKDDPRVHPGQSMELYRYLKIHNKTPVRLVFYPGEGHGNRRAASRFDYNLRMMQWIEHYLKGPGGAPPPYELSYEEKRVDTKPTTEEAKQELKPKKIDPVP